MMACNMLIAAPLNSHRGQIRKLSKDETCQPKQTEQKSKYISTQSNKPHAFHEQIYVMQSAGSLLKRSKKGCDRPVPT